MSDSDTDSDRSDLVIYIGKTQHLGQNYSVPEFPNDNSNYNEKSSSSASSTNAVPVLSDNQPGVSGYTSTQLNTVERQDKNVQSLDTYIRIRLINDLDSMTDIDERESPGNSKGPAKRRCLRSSNVIESSTNTVVNPSNPMLSSDQEFSTIIIDDDERPTIVIEDDERPTIVIEDDELPTYTVQEDEDLNTVVSVNVFWNPMMRHTFMVHKYQALTCITEHYTKNYNMNPERLFFTLDGNYVRLDESSYVSLRLNRFKTLYGSYIPQSYINCYEKLIPYQGKDIVHFQVQFNERRRKKICVTCQKNDKMEMIYWEVLKNIGELVENIRLSFNGSVIKPSTRICDMDLEEGDCFDAEITKSK